MISRASLFNKGIYKSTLRRYLWGSILYFILLFMVTGMSILLCYSNQIKDAFIVNGRESSLILDNEYLLLPILLSIVVPTVAGLLIFRFIHSKKTSVFVHSLPVRRTANYISSVLAGLTLMIAPLILNTIVLMIMSVSGYGGLFSAKDCVVWLFLNMFSVFIMFSGVSFVASLTGNSFAMIALNVLLYAVAPILTAGFIMICEGFLHGFAGESVILTKVVNNIFPVRMIEIASTWCYKNLSPVRFTADFVKFGIIAVLLYALSAVLYKARALEKAEDVAGFKCLNPILKYLLTFMGAIVAFSVFSVSIRENEFVFWCLVALVSAVIYFASEMVLQKSFKVWNSYKGYIGFTAAFALMMCLFSMTSFFGYETHIPKEDEVKTVAIYDYYRNKKPDVKNSYIIEKIINIHKELSANPPRIKEEKETAIHIEYKLKNGKAIHRRYVISEDKLHEIMNSLYKNEEYKKANEEVFREMEFRRININSENGNLEISDAKKIAEVTECIRKDILELDYDNIYSSGWNFGLEIEYLSDEEDDDENYIVDRTVSTEDSRILVRLLNKSINPGFRNTIEWLKENGYWEDIKLRNEGFIYICKDCENLPYFNYKELSEKISGGKGIKIDKYEDVEKVVEYACTEQSRYVKHGERYNVILVKDWTNGEYNLIMSVRLKEIKALFPEMDFSGKF